MPRAEVPYCSRGTIFLLTATGRLKAKKIRLDISAQAAATLEFLQRKWRGLYDWLIIRLRAGERWHVAQEKARLSNRDSLLSCCQQIGIFQAGVNDDGCCMRARGADEPHRDAAQLVAHGADLIGRLH